jgi:TRAP-type C4-dicarboxylate transport system permease small subunit
VGFVRAVDRLSDALAVIASLLLIVAALVITYSIIYRALGYSTWWELEFSVYLMVTALFLASPYTLKTKGHVAVDLLAHYLPARSQYALTLAVAVLGMLVCTYLAWVGGWLTYESFLRGERSESTWRPLKWPLYLTMPVGLGLTSVQYVAEIIRMRSTPRDAAPHTPQMHASPGAADR